MWRDLGMKSVGSIVLTLVGLTGCGVWPVMDEANGRRPQAMGKSDQLLLPNAPQPIHLNEEYGLAYRQALEHQILNPSSANNIDPVPGSADSQAIQYSLQRYQLMFQSPPFSNLSLKGDSQSGSSSGASSTASGGGSKK